MIRRMPAGLTLVAAVGALVATIGSGGLAAARATDPSVTNVQVNAIHLGPFPTNKQNEPSLAQNPANPLNLVAGSNDEIGLPPCTNTTPSSCPFTAGISVSGFYASR